MRPDQTEVTPGVYIFYSNVQKIIEHSEKKFKIKDPVGRIQLKADCIINTTTKVISATKTSILNKFVTINFELFDNISRDSHINNLKTFKLQNLDEMNSDLQSYIDRPVVVENGISWKN